MAVAFDAFTANANQTADFNFTHTPVGTPKAGIVWVVETGTTADHIAGITYGGTAMTEVAGSPNILSTGETGAVYCYFLGASIPTGAQSVSVDTTATSNYIAYCVTLTASANTEIVDSDGTINSTSITNPSVTLSLSSKTSFAALALHSGAQTVGGITPLTNWTGRSETDRGATQAACYTFDTIGTSDVTAGWTQTTEDASAICVAISEAITIFNRDIAESISISPAIVRLKTANRAVAQAVSIVDSVVEVALKLRSIAQSINISDSITAVKIKVVAIAQSINILDSIVRLKIANRVIDQAVSIVDSLVRIATLNRVINQTISVIDSLAKVVIKNRVINQTITIVDSVVEAALNLRAITQGISIV